MTDTLELLGKFLHESHGRDAVHIAVIQVVAGERLNPGESIDVEHGIATGTTQGNGVGIVDPFLPEQARKGTSFFCMLRPRTIQSLRHVWTHPDFPDEPAPDEPAPAAPRAQLFTKAESQQWLETWCDSHDAPPYDDLVEAAKRNNDDEYLHFDKDCHGEIPDEVWRHLENVIGKPLVHAKYFICAC